MLKNVVISTFLLSLPLSLGYGVTPVSSSFAEEGYADNLQALAYSQDHDSVNYSTRVYGDKTWNFGVVKYNKTYQIYRSKLLGAEGVRFLYNHLKANGLPFPKTIVYMNYVGYTRQNPQALEEYFLQTAYGYQFFHSYDYAYRTYLAFNPQKPDLDIDSEEYLGVDARKVFDLVKDGKPDGGVDAFYRILDIVLDPARQPVLFHCMGGRHRTGMVAMALRYIEGGAWLAPKNVGFNLFVPFFKNFNRAEYEYFLHNKTQFNPKNIQFIRTFAKTPEYAQYVEKYRAKLADK